MASKKIILVEGVDDEHVIKNLLQGRELLEFKQQKGVDRLEDRLRDELDASDVAALGIVVDADTDISARWDSLRNTLTNAGYQDVPGKPDPNGTIIEAPAKSLLPRHVGVWIMPDNQSKGILEDFLRKMIPEDNRLFQHAKDSVDKIPKEAILFAEPKKPKALIHTWLAWQEEPGKPPGMAIAAKSFDPNVPQAQAFIHWLERLFQIQAARAHA